MDNYFEIIELLLFFIGFVVLIRVGTTINFSQYFKKGKIREMQLIYFIVMFILAYLFARAFTHIIELSFGILN